MARSLIDIQLFTLIGCIRNPILIAPVLATYGIEVEPLLSRRARRRYRQLDLGQTLAEIEDSIRQRTLFAEHHAEWIDKRGCVLRLPLETLDLAAGKLPLAHVRCQLLGVFVDLIFRAFGSLLSASTLADLLCTSRSRIQDVLRRNSRLVVYHTYYCPNYARLCQPRTAGVESPLSFAGLAAPFPALLQKYTDALPAFKDIDAHGYLCVHRVAGKQRLGIQIANRYSLCRKRYRAWVVRRYGSWVESDRRVTQARNAQGRKTTYFSRTMAMLNRDNRAFSLASSCRRVRVVFQRVARSAKCRQERRLAARLSHGCTRASTPAPYRALANFRAAASKVAAHFLQGPGSELPTRVNLLAGLLADHVEPGHLRELAALLSSVAGDPQLIDAFEAWIQGRVTPAPAASSHAGRHAVGIFLEAWQVLCQRAGLDTEDRARFLAAERLRERSTQPRSLGPGFGPIYKTQALRGRYSSISHELADHLGLDAPLPPCPLYRAGAPPPWYRPFAS